ncbi:MAG: cytochrome c [Bacteroidetes bacterium]|nr:cytochrome c [Bacteroidota bacterium]
MKNKVQINRREIILKGGVQLGFFIILLLVTPLLKAQNLINGKKLYETRCLVCHQADGGGVPNMNAPLDGSSNLNGKDIAKLVKIIKYGYDERIALDGMYYSNAMTANPDFTDQQIADVLTYIRTSWSNKASKITLAQVKAASSKHKISAKK